MAKFRGAVGYVEEQETALGVWTSVATERTYRGDVERNALKIIDANNTVNSDISLQNTVRIVADAYANDHIHAIRYVRWAGALWTVVNAVVDRPRITLRLGGVYNGPTPEPT